MVLSSIRSSLARTGLAGAVLALGLAVGSAATVATVATVATPTAAAAAAATTRFVSLANPSRVLDTRSNVGNSPTGRPRANSITSTGIIGQAGIASNATAVVLNVTVVDADGAGFVTVFPSGSAVPVASNVNTGDAGQTIPNLVTVPLGVGGRVSIFSSTGAHLIGDVFGYYVPAASSHAGRYVSQAPVRVVDTRPTGKVAPGGVRRVALAGVPSDATAAVLNVTVTNTTGAGFWTVYAGGALNPGTSNLNVAGRDQTIANQVISPVAGGAIDVYSYSGGDLIVDLFGYFTGSSAPDATSGLFVPLAPTRFLDTRGGSDVNPLGAGKRLYLNFTLETPIIGRAGIPSSASAVVMNTTLIDASQGGFVTVYPAGTVRPGTSTVNAERRGQTIANHTITPITIRGAAAYASNGAHLVQDVTGWFTGTPQAASVPAPSNQLPAVTFPMTITLPRLGVSAPMVEGIAIEQLDGGPGHWPGTALPGRTGNMAVFGHRVSHTRPFRYLDRLGDGDEVVVSSGGFDYHYLYRTTLITSPDDVATIGQWSSEPIITLIACHPPTSIEFRIIVRAVLVDIS
jgi:LPXTG-site transpeptidase (sortase) family protein